MIGWMEERSMKPTTSYTRRPAIKIALFALSSLVVLGVQPFSATLQKAQASQLAQATRPAPVGCTLTLDRTEGPFWRAGSPERTTLIEPGMTGVRVLLTGYVYTTGCQPIANAWVDFWEADYYGAYDNTGYTLRGHTYTDASGRYRMETITPGEYPGRTVHIHVKVQAPGGPILTTQVFFPDVAHNSSDGIFHPSLVVRLENTPQDGKTAIYNFVVPTAEQPRPPSAGTSHTFKETGFTVAGRFWEAWQGAGGRSFEDSLYINGLPITAPRDEVSPSDGKTYKTQWFERARFEAHPENQAPNDVLLGLLGASAARDRQNEAPFKPVPNPGGREQWFSQTGHTLGDYDTDGGQAIITYWSQRGDVRQFGLPLSEPFMETNAGDGRTYLVQFFERQRFEYHPEYKGTRFEIMLGRLGAEQVKR
jgi:protocatechuate 3,4-dioxygenase beta subunit